jgi:hypothetical protein
MSPAAIMHVNVAGKISRCVFIGGEPSRPRTVVCHRAQKVNIKSGKVMDHRVCQMVYFRTENSVLGKFWRVLQWKLLVCVSYGNLVHFKAVWYIIRPFVLVHLLVILNIFSVLVCCSKKNLATVDMDGFNPIS